MTDLDDADMTLDESGGAYEDVSFEHLRYEVDGEVAVITVDRQEALNALNQAVLFELGLAFELAAADSAAPSSSPARAAPSSPAPT